MYLLRFGVHSIEPKLTGMTNKRSEKPILALEVESDNENRQFAFFGEIVGSSVIFIGELLKCEIQILQYLFSQLVR